MPISEYLASIRRRIGNELLLCPVVAAVISDEHGRILVQERADGEGTGWSLPGGFIDPGESPQQAVVREVLEETGLVVSAEEILGVFGGPGFRHTYRNGHQVDLTAVLFRCAVTARSGQAPDDETLSLQYFDRESMPVLARPYPLDLLFRHLNHE